MLNETELRELLHTILINNKAQVKMTNIESQVFIAAGLSTDNSRKEMRCCCVNIRVLKILKSAKKC